MMQEFQSKHQELVSALVERIDPRSGAASLRIGKAEAVLPKSEQVGNEVLKGRPHQSLCGRCEGNRRGPAQ